MNIAERPHANPGAAANRLVEIAASVKATDGGRVDAGKVNAVFLREGGNADEFRAGITFLKGQGIVEMHSSGTFFRFTEHQQSA